MKTTANTLLEAATSLFIQKGYEAVTTRQIAQAANVNLGAIQYHFGSKGGLFVEVIRNLMARSGCSLERLARQEPIASPEQAAEQLVRFISEMLAFLVMSPGPQPCRMLFREVFADPSRDAVMYEELLSSAVRDFAKPIRDALRHIVGHLAPGSNEDELRLVANSIAGQCSFYFTHGAFLERLDNQRMGEQQGFEMRVHHVAAFSLKALGYDDGFIAAAITRAPQPREWGKVL